MPVALQEVLAGLVERITGVVTGAPTVHRGHITPHPVLKLIALLISE
jgi:hypothetical protein